MLRTADYKYHLPTELIAQTPPGERDAGRLMVLQRSNAQVRHDFIRHLPAFLRPDDLLVFNNSRVIPARLRAFKPGSGGAVEVLLVEEITVNDWWVMLRPGKRVRRGTSLHFRRQTGEQSTVEAEVLEKSAEGHYRLRFSGTEDLKGELAGLGEIPLPPYIERPEGPGAEDAARYQTVFAKPPGSVAAPTAGLHFTPELLQEIVAIGAKTTEVTLHVGLGTFAPVKAADLTEHVMHEERYEMSESAARSIRATREAGGRVIAIGTTALRVLESVAAAHGEAVAARGRTRLFVYPPYEFKLVDALFTNFHLPESTLLMLVSAFAAPGETSGRETILKAYAEAVEQRYRFFSYGDAILIL